MSPKSLGEFEQEIARIDAALPLLTHCAKDTGVNPNVRAAAETVIYSATWSRRALVVAMNYRRKHPLAPEPPKPPKPAPEPEPDPLLRARTWDGVRARRLALQKIVD